jgi:hypothetical protein
MTIDFSSQTPLYLGMYEWELHRFMRSIVPGAGLAFDVGANVGYESLVLASLGATSVVSFEPDPDALAKLRSNIAENPDMADRITVVPEAVGAEPGSGITTVDAAAERFGVPDVLKIDVDGAELDVLHGARKTLVDRHPHLVLEVHSAELERSCGEFLVECGYQPVIKHNREVWREYRSELPVCHWLLAEGAAANA